MLFSPPIPCSEVCAHFLRGCWQCGQRALKMWGVCPVSQFSYSFLGRSDAHRGVRPRLTVANQRERLWAGDVGAVVPP